MYIPKYFQQGNMAAIEAFIRNNSFAILINVADGKPLGTHIPVELEVNEHNEKVLWCHIAKSNHQWKSFESNPEVLVIFSGPHHYISSSWYNHLNVPTWNFIAVHVSGKVSIMSDEKLLESLKRLVKKYEAASKNPVSVETMPEDFVGKLLKGVVGMEISIEKLEGKWKLSQNRDDESAANVIRELEQLGNEDAMKIADEMKKVR